MKNAVTNSLGIALWFMFLAVPLLAVRVDTLHNVVEWRWMNVLWVGAATFVLVLLWRSVAVQFPGLPSQLPPRITLYVPLTGPGGLLGGDTL